MGNTSLHQERLIMLVAKTRDLSIKERHEMLRKGLEDMGKEIFSYSVVWKNTEGKIINDVDCGYDKLHCIERIMKEPNYKEILFIQEFPLSKKDMDERFKLTGVKPT